ncbi:MAG: Crp/Fnr family transcriptional regulator [Patescibacteria group bacterium]
MNKTVSKKIESFFVRYKHQTYKKGEILIRADEYPSGVFYLKEGVVKEYAISKKGEEVVVNIFKPGSFFPMSWAINSTPNNFYFEAVSRVEAWKAPKEPVLEFIKSNPDVLYDLTSRVYKGIDDVLMRSAYLMFGNAYERLIQELVIQSKRFGVTRGHFLDLRTSEKDLASQSGLTRETVSRELKTLKDKGFVVFNKHILTIKNLRELEKEL